MKNKLSKLLCIIAILTNGFIALGTPKRSQNSSDEMTAKASEMVFCSSAKKLITDTDGFVIYYDSFKDNEFTNFYIWDVSKNEKVTFTYAPKVKAFHIGEKLELKLLDGTSYYPSNRPSVPFMTAKFNEMSLTLNLNMQAARENDTAIGTDNTIPAIPQSELLSEKHLKQIKSGDGEAQYLLALMYFNAVKTDLNRDIKASKEWASEAIKNGEKKAHNLLGVIARSENNSEEAFEHFKIAAESDYYKAQFNLAQAYHFGSGTEQNFDKAISWYTKAAENNFGLASFLLGCMYTEGNGVKKDLETAKKWLTKAISQGNEDAKEYLAKMPPGNPEQITPEPKTEKVIVTQPLDWVITHIHLGDMSIDEYKGQYFQYQRYPTGFDFEAEMLKNSPHEYQKALLRYTQNGSIIVVKKYKEMKAVLCMMIIPALQQEVYFLVTPKSVYNEFSFIKNGNYRYSETIPLSNGLTLPLFVEE